MHKHSFLPSFVLAVSIAAALAGCGDKTTPPEPKVADTAAAPAAMPAPEVVQAPVAAPAPAPAPVASAAAPAAAPAGNLANGEKIYTATCLACHGAGVLGAPKIGDKAAWQPRIAQGVDILHHNALAGIRMMPPKGGNAGLSDQDVQDAVDYMASKAV